MEIPGLPIPSLEETISQSSSYLPENLVKKIVGLGEARLTPDIR